MEQLLHSLVDNQIKKDNEIKRASGKGCYIRDLIDDLEKVNSDLKVKIEGGYSLDNETDNVFYSWRGDYGQLAIAFHRGEDTITAGELLKMARGSISKTFCGYKGGDFTMDRDTTIHIANYGKSCFDDEGNNAQLLGAEEREGIVVLKIRKYS